MMEARAKPTERVVEFLRRQMRRGVVTRFDLCQVTPAGEAPVDTFPVHGAGKAEEIAAAIHAIAIDDGGTKGGRYVILARIDRSKDEAGARCAFTVHPGPDDGTGPSEPANTQGVIAQTMRHLDMQAHAAQTLLLEGVEAVADARTSVVEQWRQLAIAKDNAHEMTVGHLQKALTQAHALIERVMATHFDLVALQESLASEKGERDLAVKRQDRKDLRADKALEVFASTFMPLIGMKVTKMLGAGDAGGAPVASGPAKVPLPQFSDTQLLAIGRFLAVLDGPTLMRIRDVLADSQQALLDALVGALMEGPPANTNSGAAGANGAAAHGEVS